jgi:hypothetical protein
LKTLWTGFSFSRVFLRSMIPFDGWSWTLGSECDRSSLLLL